LLNISRSIKYLIMKKIIIALGLIIFGLSGITAQTPEKVENPNSPIITFNKLVHDYGTLYQNGNGECEFEFTNSGKEPLILTNVKSSCGCTVPKWPRQPLLPGKSDVIKVKYATSRLGTINKSITVTSNASNNNVVLRIAGKVVATPKETMPEKNIDGSGSPVAK